MCGAQSPSVNNDVPGTLYPVGICYYVLYPAPHVANVANVASQYMWVAAVNANNTAVRIAEASAKAQCLASVVGIGRRGWAAFVVAPAEADRRGGGGEEGKWRWEILESKGEGEAGLMGTLSGCQLSQLRQV